jgi:hypothetical protein
MFDPSNSWQPAPQMSTARNFLGLAALDGRLYAVGGAQQSYFSTVERFWNAKVPRRPPFGDVR